jgi:hypothetical protein
MRFAGVDKVFPLLTERLTAEDDAVLERRDRLEQSLEVAGQVAVEDGGASGV